MSSKALSERRKAEREAGRKAFDPNVNPMDVQPYRHGSWAFEYSLSDWLEGWKEAEKEYKDKIISNFEEVEEVSLTQWEKDAFFNKVTDFTHCPNCGNILASSDALGKTCIFRCDFCSKKWKIEERK